jgi:DNA-binding MarR family transcriptional regulator
MSSVSSTDRVPTSPGRGDARHRRRLTAAIKDSMRDLGNQLTLLNHHVGSRLQIKDVDFDCLEVINRHGPISPSALARRTGLHPATMTGVLDRLERGGWIIRDRDPQAVDRRAVTVRATRDRVGEVFHLYAGMNASMDRICDRYDDAQLQILADFLQRTTSAGRAATEELA